MWWIGSSSLQRSVSEPFFLLDQCLSHRIAYGVSRVSGYPVTPVRDEWPERDLSVNAPKDWEIIPHLGAKAGHLGVWITLDWGALAEYAHLIERHRISVLWLRGADGGGFSLLRAQQSQLLAEVIGMAYPIFAAATAPVYLRARLAPGGGAVPLLERLAGSLLEAPLRWVAAPLG